MTHPANLVLRFPAPGFFLTDTKVGVDLDGRCVYEGSFKAGFELELVAEPGEHRLATRIDVAGMQRTKDLTFSLGAQERLVATLRYSRMWGNFKGKLGLERSPAP